MVLRDCPTSHARTSPSYSLGIHDAGPLTICRGQTQDLPVPEQGVSVRARGLRLRGVRYISRINDMADIAFHTNGLRRHPELTKLSQLNTRPAHTSVNASPMLLRAPAHDSRPVWVATPSPYDSFIRCSLPVTGAFPFDLRNHSSGFVPTCCFVLKAFIQNNGFSGWTAHGAGQQMLNLAI